ncbi:Secondary metabolism regulator LAE1 [Lachnellula cervina]|uniref:Secondary metabolism regulator LAE1 n=1 Tax=Lachnellula cervina TaxID=1316786 RepID=A0A7D8YYW2_9HELO|nr:Secondary metabolism regulator LAE1 [Lachnellula cervina]
MDDVPVPVPVPVPVAVPPPLPAAVHGDDAIEAEFQNDFEGDSAYAGSSYAGSVSGSLTETLSSAVARGVEEHGRTYAAYGNEEYGLPIDEEELDRIDMSHAKYIMLLDKKLFLAPINPQPQRILDLGTGTGLWAINVADAFPSAEVLGLDIAPVQPQWVPANCRFEIDDIEQSWVFGNATFDLIHARDLLLSIRDWPKLVSQCYEHTKPGGYTELQCVLPHLHCDDGSAPPNSGLFEFSRQAQDASTILGLPLDACTRYADYMTAAGFVDVVEKRFKMPTSAWPKEKRLKLIGAFEMHNLVKGVSAMSLRMFNKAYGWSREQIEMFLTQVRKDTQNVRCKLYPNISTTCVRILMGS